MATSSISLNETLDRVLVDNLEASVGSHISEIALFGYFLTKILDNFLSRYLKLREVVSSGGNAPL